MGEHAKWSPSQMPRLIRCPGSIDFIKYLEQKKTIPVDEETVYSSEGVWLHKQTELQLQDKPMSKELTGEQATAIDDCMDFYYELVKKHDLTWEQIESRVDLSNWGVNKCWGTADIKAGHKQETMHIIDWKFGQGVYVDINANEQLMTYLLGAVENPQKLDKLSEVWIHLAQPRLDNFASYQCDVEELKGFVNVIKNAQAQPHLICAGEKQCFWCKAKNHCAEYEELVRDKASLIFSGQEKLKNNEIDMKHMIAIMRLENEFKRIFKSVKDELERLDAGGLRKQGLKRVAGRSFRQWANEKKVAEYLLNNYADDHEQLFKPVELRTPAQIEKEFKGVKKDPKFQEMIYKPIGKPTIVSADDPRPDYTAETAGEVFKSYVE